MRIDPARINAVQARMTTLKGDVTADLGALRPLLDDLPNRREDVITGIDDALDKATALLLRAASFGLPQTRSAALADQARRVFAKMIAALDTRVGRWDARLSAHDALVAEVPSATTDEEKIALLRRAELEVSTAAALPQPTVQDRDSSRRQTRNVPTETKPTGVAARTTDGRMATLRQQIATLLPIDAFDADPFDLAIHEGQIVKLARDIATLGDVLGRELDKRLSATAQLLLKHDSSADRREKLATLTAAAKTLLGDAFIVIPEFTLGITSGQEIENALNASRSGNLFRHLTSLDVQLPVEEWLTGVARVREPMHLFESTCVLADGFGTAAPVLDAIQLPNRANDYWLGLDFPPSLISMASGYSMVPSFLPISTNRSPNAVCCSMSGRRRFRASGVRQICRKRRCTLKPLACRFTSIARTPRRRRRSCWSGRHNGMGSGTGRTSLPRYPTRCGSLDFVQSSRPRSTAPHMPHSFPRR